MSNNLKIILLIVLLIYLFIILKSVKHKNMRINYLVFWSITGVCLVIALLIPNCVEFVSRMVGFNLPINMIFSGAIFVILYLIFDQTRLITKVQNKNTMLIQELSILKKRVEELEAKNNEK